MVECWACPLGPRYGEHMPVQIEQGDSENIYLKKWPVIWLFLEL